MTLTIECKQRPEGSKPNALRRDGLIPANLYGHKGAESDSLTVNEKEALYLMRNAKVDETVIDVTVPDLSWQGKAVIREAQIHPWKKKLYHLSFFHVKDEG